jgi:hypothetical protein
LQHFALLSLSILLLVGLVEMEFYKGIQLLLEQQILWDILMQAIGNHL